MSMITKCPSCNTAFRVTPQQLQAHHGMVRCGRCAMVFDGFKTLAAQRADLPQVAAPPSPPPVQPHDLTQQPAGLAAAPAAPEVPVAVFDTQVVVAEPEPVTPPDVTAAPITPAPDVVVPLQTEARESPVADLLPQASQHESATTVSTAPAAIPDPADSSTMPAYSALPPASALGAEVAVSVAPRKRSALWAPAALLLLLTLAAQGIYFFRGDIAAHMPEARPYLNQACAQLGCTVALPQRPQQIKIAASDVQATDPANPGYVVVTATLRSESAITLGYPALDVVFTNVKDHTVARRIFLPSEYLDAGKDVHAGILPNGEITVALNIDSGDLGAAGFRLDVLAAPAP
jgi:predicted Zn finger-like uncharacterized protein